MVLRNVVILLQHYKASQPEDEGNTVLRNADILYQYTISQPINHDL
jgi:hypothetical protein